MNEAERGYRRAITDINASRGREMEASAELQGLCDNLDSRRSSFPLFFFLEGHGFNDFSAPVSSETCATVPFQKFPDEQMV